MGFLALPPGVGLAGHRKQNIEARKRHVLAKAGQETAAAGSAGAASAEADTHVSSPACLPVRFPRDPTLIAEGRCCIFPCMKIQSDTFSLLFSERKRAGSLT